MTDAVVSNPIITDPSSLLHQLDARVLSKSLALSVRALWKLMFQFKSFRSAHPS